MIRIATLTVILFTALFPAVAEPYAKQSETKDSVGVEAELLSLIQTVCVGDSSKVESNPLNLSALDYLSSVYEDADYYTTGDCDTKKRKNIGTGVYINGLPESLLTNFSHPVKGRITSPFGLREGGGRMHKGVDISLKKGDGVFAAFDGKVARVGYEKGGYGYFIILEHADGFQSRYAHLQQPLVKPGDEITSGAQIALGGTSGNSTGPHLHFEIRCQRKPLDPTPLLKRT